MSAEHLATAGGGMTIQVENGSPRIVRLTMKTEKKKQPKVTWTEETVNNENMQKKSSKSKF